MRRAHPIYFQEIIQNPSLDAICRGEGEYALKELADTLDFGGDAAKIKNLWLKVGGVIKKMSRDHLWKTWICFLSQIAKYTTRIIPNFGKILIRYF